MEITFGEKNYKGRYLMKTIVLISCVKTQKSYKSKAKDLFTSTYFTKSLEYATRLNPDKIFILSSKYGLLDLDEEITPYDVSLRAKISSERKIWANGGLEKLKKVSAINNDKFILLAFDKYLEYIKAEIKNKKIPMEGLKQGEKLQWLTTQLNHINTLGQKNE
jgi:cytoplasmic iron level regulating protein YaaA (DUF328/UPF0246 family)